VDKFDSGPPVDAAVEYSIDGPDLNILRALGKKLELIVRDAPGVFLTKVGLLVEQQTWSLPLMNPILHWAQFQEIFLLMS